MLQRTTWNTEKVPLSTHDRYADRPETAMSYFGSPPLSPPPSSPLPLPPISSYSISSLHSNTPPARSMRVQPSLSNPQAKLPPSRSSCDTSHDVTILTEELLESQTPIAGVNASGSASNSTPNYYHKPFVSNAFHRERANRRLWQPGTFPSPGAITDETSAYQTTKALMHTNSISKRKRRSKHPPKRAIARSALYVPSTETLTALTALQDMSSLRSTRRATPLLLDEFLTSLPVWPNPGGLKSALAIKDNERMRRGREILTMPLPNRSDGENLSVIANRSAVAQKEITFRPVTNLEQSSYRKGATLSDFENATQNMDESEPEIRAWYVQHKRPIWLAIAVVFVTLATGGLLTGILWRLTRA